MLWADEPHTRLIPQEPVLQALRIFANQAMEALAVATQLEETRFLADHDPLTRLLNRRAFCTSSERRPRRARTEPLALVFLDVDNFKEINDAYGHTAGDRVLAQFATLLAELVREEDHAFRVAATSSRCCSAAPGRCRRARSCRGSSPRSANIDPLVRRLSASFGVATSGRVDEPEALLRVADEAMYQAKRSGTRIEVAA